MKFLLWLLNTLLESISNDGMVNGKLSSIENISCDVPQRSGLELLLFLFFVNSMPYSLTKAKVNAYALSWELTSYATN